MPVTEGRYFDTGDLDLAVELYETLDALLEGIGLLPLNQITTRPRLHDAVIEGHKVIDLAVKEGRYVSTKES